MRKRLISVCIVAIIVFSVCACGQTASDTPASETEIAENEDAENEIAEKEDTETRSEEEDISEEEEEETEEETAKLFNSQGVYIQILAEDDEEGRLIGFQSTGTPTDIDGEEWEACTYGFLYHAWRS